MIEQNTIVASYAMKMKKVKKHIAIKMFRMLVSLGRRIEHLGFQISWWGHK